MHHLPSRYIPCDGRLTSSAYFNPHSPHGERQSSSLLCVVLHYISIHAPRMGSDDFMFSRYRSGSNFNPRSPQGERLDAIGLGDALKEFQSTLPAGGATEETPYKTAIRVISIHAPRRGSDIYPVAGVTWWVDFNPRSPQGERHTGLLASNAITNFNPRSPQGERLLLLLRLAKYLKFQSTLPAGGATLTGGLS